MTRPALRERFLETAARLAASDQEIAPEELQVLTRMAQRLQLEPGAVDRVVADVINSPKGSTALPTDRGERLALFHDLCEVAAADGRVASVERRLLERVARTLELPPGTVADALGARLERRERLSGPLAKLRNALLLGLVVTVAYGPVTFLSGLVSSYEGVVETRRAYSRGGGGRSFSVFELQLRGGDGVDVPPHVYEAAAPGATVTKRFLAPWWTVDGRTWLSPVALGALLSLLSLVIGGALHELRGLDSDLVLAATFGLLFGAFVANGAVEETRSTAAGLLALLAGLVGAAGWYAWRRWRRARGRLERDPASVASP